VKPKIVAICGPTGVGKTELGVFLAEALDGEVVNYDSVQIYRELNIGTAKPTEEEKKGIPHHLYDVISIKEEFNAAKFVELADKVVAEIGKKGRIPILVGGTGLYLRAFEYGLFKVEVDPEVREKLRKQANSDLQSLYEELKAKDPDYAQKISPNDRVRIVRALEVILSTGKKFSYFHEKNRFFTKKRYSIIKVGLLLDRKELYSRINKRVLKMIEKGWIEEVKKLLEAGYPPDLKAFNAIGYRHIINYLKGELSLERAIELIQRDTRRYAKRQITWFKKEPDITWFKPWEKEEVLEFVKSRIKN